MTCINLPLFFKSLTKVLLKLLRSFYPTIHYSFGDDDEMAHIVIPAYRFFERLIATKPGETPPTLGEPFIESEESIKMRKSSQYTGDWNTTDTYSMSFYSMYLDLPTWSVVNIPLSNDMPLQTFWGKSFLRICVYERVAPESEKKHLPKYNKYGFVMQAKYLGPSSRSIRAVDKVPSDSNNRFDENGEEISGWLESGNILDWTETPNRNKELKMGMRNSESQIFNFDEEAESSDDVSVFDDNQFFDAEEHHDSEGNLSNVVLSHAPELLTSVDNVCPAWIEMLVHKGNYARAYAINLPDASRTLFRKSDEVLGLFGSGGPNDNICSPRMSTAETTRRHLGQLLLDGARNDKDPKSILVKLQSTSTKYDDHFLNRRKPSNTEKSRAHASCFVARSLSDHHWIEEWATVTDRGVNFYHPDRKKANHRVGIQGICKVVRMEPSDAPWFPCHFFLSLETLGRTTYLMFSTQDDRDKFLKSISILAKLSPSAVDSAETSSDGNTSTALLDLQNPKDEFLHKSSLWDYKHRRVLNCRRFSFRARDKSSQHNPLLLAEDALRKALDPRNESDDEILISFLDSAAKLKEANVHDLSEEERLAFFLNMYHIMVMHAYLVLGTPGSSFQWISYFNSISYQCSDDIFSLAELEHCIIRSPLSFPTQFLSRFVLPKSTYDFALKKADFRINFALNCGSMSNPKCVPIFRAPLLNQQLDAVSRLYLSSATKLKKRGARDVDVFLPRICLWFSNDFGPRNEDVLSKVKPFFSMEIEEFLDSCKTINVSVKYLNYSFECRKLTLTPEDR